MKIPMDHRHAAHCESGALVSLLSNQGTKVSESMVFGLSSALVFLHFPWLKMGGCGLTSYRIPPGGITKRFAKMTGLGLKVERFRTPTAGTEGLKRLLDQGHLVGCQTSVYWLPYFPPHMRFHFNAHNLVVYGYDDQGFHISDPVLEEVVVCPEKDFEKARFAKGVFAPKGKCSILVGASPTLNYETLIPKAIKKTCRQMLSAPLPWVGIKGAMYLANKIETMPDRLKDLRRVHLELTTVIRMQEEIGTGGAGFRFIQAAFLQEASEILHSDDLKSCSESMTLVGDSWRSFATSMARLVKKGGTDGYKDAAEQLRACAQDEAKIHRKLLKIVS